MEAKYAYDAWGNHEVYGSATTIRNLNPFRYRGYYYDTETGLYYLQTRYYDPKNGRFLNMDSIDYADPERIGGLNLYAYCNNDPVNYTDPTGTFIGALGLAMLGGALIGGVVGGISALARDENFWPGALSGAIVGGALGGSAMLGGLAMLTIAGKAVSGFVVANTIAAKVAVLATTFTASVILSAGAGMGAYTVREKMNGMEVDPMEMIRQGFMTGIKGGVAFFAGMALSSTGSFDYLLKGIEWSISKKFGMAAVRGITGFVLQFPFKLGLQ